MEERVLHLITQYGYLGISSLLVLGIVGLPVPDETLLMLTGYLVFSRRLHLAPAFFAALLGSICGITVSYVLGRSFGLPLIHRFGKYLHITEDRIAKVHDWFESVGRWALAFGYFIPGVRHLTAYAAGMSYLEPHEFALFAYSGAFLWCSTFIGLGYFLGERWREVYRQIEHHALIAALAGAGLLALFLIWRRVRRK